MTKVEFGQLPKTNAHIFYDNYEPLQIDNTKGLSASCGARFTIRLHKASRMCIEYDYAFINEIHCPAGNAYNSMIKLGFDLAY